MSLPVTVSLYLLRQRTHYLTSPNVITMAASPPMLRCDTDHLSSVGIMKLVQLESFSSILDHQDKTRDIQIVLVYDIINS